MEHKELLINGTILLLLSIVQILFITRMPYTPKNQSNDEDDVPWLKKYYRFYDRVYSYPVFVMLFASSLSLIYNWLAFKYDWPVFLEFLFGPI